MTPRERRFVIGGLLASLLILAVGLAPRLLRGGGGEEAAAAELEAERLARLRGLAASLDSLRGVAGRSAVAERRLAERFLDGATPQVSASRLSEVVRQLADRAQVELLREGVLPPQELGRATAVPLQVVARGDLPGLLEFLDGLHASPVLLSVDDLSVSGDPRDLPGVAALTITLQVTGYLLRDSSGVEGT